MTSRRLALALILCCTLFAAAGALSQSADSGGHHNASPITPTSRSKPTNIKALPKDISGEEIAQYPQD